MNAQRIAQLLKERAKYMAECLRLDLEIADEMARGEPEQSAENDTDGAEPKPKKVRNWTVAAVEAMARRKGVRLLP